MAYDEPILRNIAAKNDGLKVLPEMITVDNYALAVSANRVKECDRCSRQGTGGRAATMKMQARWFPKKGNPAAMPEMPLDGAAGVLKPAPPPSPNPSPCRWLATGGRLRYRAAKRVAKQQGKTLEVVNMEFGSLIPALISGKVDMIAACITITDERAQKVLFSEPYYTGGIGCPGAETKP